MKHRALQSFVLVLLAVDVFTIPIEDGAVHRGTGEASTNREMDDELSIRMIKHFEIVPLDTKRADDDTKSLIQPASEEGSLGSSTGVLHAETDKDDRERLDYKSDMKDDHDGDGKSEDDKDDRDRDGRRRKDKDDRDKDGRKKDGGDKDDRDKDDRDKDDHYKDGRKKGGRDKDDRDKDNRDKDDRDKDGRDKDDRDKDGRKYRDSFKDKDKKYFDAYFRQKQKEKNSAGGESDDFWRINRDDPISHYPSELRDRKSRGEIIQAEEVDKFENEFGRYKEQRNLAVIDLIHVVNQANDVTDVVESDIKLDVPNFDYKIFQPTPQRTTPAPWLGNHNWGIFGQFGKREAEEEKRDARRDREYLWINKVVPYEIAPELADARSIIETAIRNISRSIDGCLNFKVRTTEPNWIRFVKKDGCWSSVGRTFWMDGFQEISLGTNCLYLGTIIHEILHSLGFWHEQSRPDRDQFVEIFWENIDPAEVNNFNKYGNVVADVLGAPYDLQSIMHYGSMSFSVTGAATMKAIVNPDTAILGQREGLSRLDIFQLKELYDCAGPRDGWSNWSGFGPCNEGCLKKRTRYCTNAARQSCAGANFWGTQANEVPCPPVECNAPIDGNWNRWSSWGACSVTCDTGTHQRVRQCTDPAPKNGGKGCPGSASATQRCVMRGCSLGEFDCEFDVDGFCKFINDPRNTPGFNWLRNSGRTPSAGTGPPGDHTSGSGFYAFIESSSPARPGHQARLISPVMSPGQRCLDFCYSMFGISTGRLTVYVQDERTGSRTPVFQKTGDQGQGWYQQLVDINNGANTYRVVFEAERGSSYQGDSALDDIYFKTGTCAAATATTAAPTEPARTTAPPTEPARTTAPPTEPARATSVTTTTRATTAAATTAPSVIMTSAAPTQAPKIWTVTKIGCFNDFGFVAGKRPFTFTKDMRSVINWKDNLSFDKIVADCSVLARDNGWEYFAIQFFGECWSGATKDINYGRDGTSLDCYIGTVGKTFTMMVYRWILQ